MSAISNVLAPKYYSVRAISRYTSIPVKTLYDWASQGILPSIKIGKRVLFDLHDIDAVMERMKRPTVDPAKSIPSNGASDE